MQAIGLTTKTLGPLGLVAAALGVVAGAYTAVKKAQEAAAKAEEERMQANRDAVSEPGGAPCPVERAYGTIHRAEPKDVSKL